MSYTAIPPQDRTMKLPCNGYSKRCNVNIDRDSSLKSPPSIQRRVSTSILQNPTALRKSAPEHQEIYEGFTFLDEQRRKDTGLCPDTCTRLLQSYVSVTELVQLFKCGHESINPFSFKDSNLERIYYKYFSIVYRSSQLAKFFLLLSLFCLVLFILELTVSISSLSSLLDNVRGCLFLTMFIVTCLPLIHMHCQKCMRPQHMGLLKTIGLLVSCLLLVTVSPIWGNFVKDSPSVLTVGLWETIWLILLISCFFPVTFYTLLALIIFLCISHSIISILVILLSNQITFSSNHWTALCGNWMLFIATILLGSVISYLQQKMLRHAFLNAREFLNCCVETKVANEKLDRLLSCIVPHPIMPELKHSMISYDQRDQLPSVVHLRNVSFVNVEICGLSRGAKCDGNGSNFPADAVKLMNELFSRFDMLGQELGCYRVRGHPDDYLSLAGYPETRVDHAKSCTELAFRIQQTIRQLCDSAEIQLEARTVVHTGVTYGAIIGHSRMVFDLLGDDIRVLRYMIAVATPGKVMVSKLTYDQLPDGYKGENGPSLDLPLISMSMSSSGDSNRMETMYLRPRNNKQSSLLTEVNMIMNEPCEKVHEDIEARLLRAFPLLTSLSEGEDSTKQNQRSTSHGLPVKTADKDNDRGDGQLSRSGRSDSLSSSTNHITKTMAFNKLAQAAKFNANIPYYFLSDETFLLTTPDDDRLLLDIGGGFLTSTITGSPLFHGTTKSSVSWKSTLRSQLTQSLIGSYMVDEGDISMKGRLDSDISISKLTGVFHNHLLELKFQNLSESYMGFALLTCLSTILLVTGVHGLLLAKTVMLLLIFLVVFIWIGLALLLILLAKMKCISADIIQSRLSCIIVLSITILGIFTLFATNSFCCLNEIPIVNNTVHKAQPVTAPSASMTTTMTPVDHLKCQLPIYIPLATTWISLPLISMMMLPEIVKVVVVLCTSTCTMIIVFWTHATLFDKFNNAYRLDGIPVKYIFGIIMQVLFAIIILWMSRILNAYRRLVFQWHVKSDIKRDQCNKLSSTADKVVDILLPKFVSSYFINPSRNYMNLYANEHKTIAVLSVSIPSWCPIGVTEPSDVANNIRVLNQLLMSFDKLIMQPEFEMITKIRTAGETSWYAVGVDCDNPLMNPLDRAHSMFTLLRAAEMMKRIVEDHNFKSPDCRLVLRIGIHSGCGFSGVVGGSNPEYGVWGDAYFGATLIQRCGQLDKIHLSSNFISEIDPNMKYSFYDMGTLTFNSLGQLVALPSGQFVPNTTSIRVFVLREKSPSYGSSTITGVISFPPEEVTFPMSARRNSLSVVTGIDQFNPYMMSPGPFMTASNVPSPPIMFSVQQNLNNKSSSIYCTPHITNLPELDIPTNVPSIIPSMMISPIMNSIVPQVITQPSNKLPTNPPIAPKIHQEIVHRKSLIEGRSKIHHYRNLATELSDSVIPPSPPPHRRSYFDKKDGHYSPPGIPPRSGQVNNMSMSDCQRVPERPKEITKMTQSAISPSEERNLRPPKCLTPSSSMDSFLELEKACTTNPRIKPSNYSFPPNERLSLIPEAYKHVKDMNIFEDDSIQDLDKASLDVMATSYNRNYDLEEVDIMSHHNPIYTDNEYESMAESQMNLLDPIDEIRRSRIVNLRCGNNRQCTATSPLSNNDYNNIVSKPPEAPFDFPDYKRPSSPNAVVNGDDSDHLSKRNRNSSNSRDSSSIAARISGGATSSDESGQNKHKKLTYEDNDRNVTDLTNQSVAVGMDVFSAKQQQCLIEDSYKGDHLPLSMQCTIPTRDTTTDGGFNGSPCTSLVTDMGWTSCEEEDVYSDYPGYASKDQDYDRHNCHESSKWSEVNDRLLNRNQVEEDDSDIDCMRFHSDLISDFSENPLVSDLDNETDYEARSSDLGVISSTHEGRINALYKFPLNNRFNSDFLGKRGYAIRSENGADGLYSEDDMNGRKIFASHPWNHVPTGSLPQAMDESIYTQPPLNHDDHSSASSNVISKTSNDVKTSSRLPEIAPVRMPDFNSSKIHMGMCRDVVQETPVSRFVQKHGRYTSSSPERSEYDNVSEKNSLLASREGRIILRDRMGLESTRYINGEDSDAMSGYVGDVASSVYDSDDYEDDHGRRFTQVYLDYNVDQEDPMAPFFPRLPSVQVNNKVDESKINSDSNSNTGSAVGPRSDYDNVDSDKYSSHEENKVSNCNGFSKKYPECDDSYQKQIAAEARRISLVFKNQWSNDLHKSTDPVLDSLEDLEVVPSLTDHTTLDNAPTKSFLLQSQRETSADTDNSSVNCHSYGGDFQLNQNISKCPVTKSQSTDCIISPVPFNKKVLPNGDSSINEDLNAAQRNSKDLSKIIKRAECVKNLLPSELHQYILPGCISSSSLNSSSDRDSLADDLNQHSILNEKSKTQKHPFSDKERSAEPM